MQNTQYHFEVPRVGKAFMGLVLFETLVILVVSIYLFTKQDTDTSKYYITLVLVTALFLCYFAIESIFDENPFQLLGFLVISCLLTLRVVFHFVNSHAEGKSSSWQVVVVPLVFACLCSAAYFPLGFFVHRSFGWKVFKRVGAVNHQVMLFKRYHLFLTTLKTDAQFLVVLLLMAVFFVDYKWAMGLLVAGVVLSVIFAVVVVEVGVKLERAIVVLIFEIWSTIAAPAYVIYKMVQIHDDENVALKQVSGDSRDNVISNIYTTSVLFLICRALLVFGTIVMHRSLRHGLRQSVFDKERTFFGAVISRLMSEDTATAALTGSAPRDSERPTSGTYH